MRLVKLEVIMEHREIVRTEDERKGKFFIRMVFGLNILWVNTSDFPVEEDPQLEFLRRLCSANAVSLNVGNLYDYVDEPEELFASTAYSKRYRTVRIGCYSGDFYDSEQWSNFPPLFFESVSPDFIDITDLGKSLVRKVLQLDAFAFFVSPRGTESADKLAELLNGPFESTETLIDKALGEYHLVALSGADGDHFTFFAHDEGEFGVLAAPIASATDVIEATAWYQENWSTLVWDDEYSGCLMEPSLIRT